MRWIPNGLSIIRLICAPFIAYLILCGHEQLALYAVIVAFSTDLLDGWMARKYRWESPLGQILDPLADKVLIFCIFGALCLSQKIPLLLCFITLLRDICIGLGAWILRRKKNIHYFQPILMSKINTAMQGLFCVAILWGISAIGMETLTLTLWSTTLLSFACYGYKLFKTWH